VLRPEDLSMTADPKAQAALALHRFGMGPRAGSIAAIAGDPRGALLAELERPGAGQIANAGLMTSGAANRAAFEFNAERNAKQRLEARRKEAAKQVAAATGMENTGMEKQMEAPPPAATPPETPMQQIFFSEAKAHFDAAIHAEIGFVERVVWF